MKPATDLQDLELILRLKQGEEQAFEELVGLFKDRVYNTILGMVQSEADAEDLTQEVFIKIFENISGFKGEAQLSTWIYRIATTQALDWMRSKGRKKRGGLLVRLFDRKDEDLTEFRHPGIAAEKREEAALLFKAMRALPEQQQTAFILQKTEGLSQKEIAAIMNTTESAIESLLQRAKANLRKQLGKLIA